MWHLFQDEKKNIPDSQPNNGAAQLESSARHIAEEAERNKWAGAKTLTGNPLRKNIKIKFIWLGDCDCMTTMQGDQMCTYMCAGSPFHTVTGSLARYLLHTSHALYHYYHMRIHARLFMYVAPFVMQLSRQFSVHM